MVDHQLLVLGSLMVVAVVACFSTYKRSVFAATWFILPILWIVFASFVAGVGIGERPRTYCASDGGLAHFSIQEWPKHSYAVCKDKVDEDFQGKTETIRTKGIFGTPIGDLPRLAR